MLKKVTYALKATAHRVSCAPRGFIYLVALIMLLSPAAGFGQSVTDLSISNQRISNDTFYFDIYLQRAGASDYYLGNCDFVLNYDYANFSNTTFGMVSGSTVFYNALTARTHYYDNTIWHVLGNGGNANQLLIYLVQPTVSTNTDFNTKLAKIDTTTNKSRLGTFYLTGMQAVNKDAQLSWVTAGPAMITSVYGLNSTTYDGSSVAINNASDPTPATKPTTQSSGLTFSSITSSSMKLNITTTGNGANRIILAKAGSPIDPSKYPADEITYTADSAYGSGTQIGDSSGVYVVYAGSGTSVNISNLSANTTYYYSVFEYNGGSGASNSYLTTNPLIGSQTTYSTEPSTASSSLIFSNLSSSGMTLTWTNGNGANHLVVAKQASPVDGTPADGTSYTASSAFGSGTQIGTGNYVVYSGTGNTVTLTGLSSGTRYYYAIYDYNGSSGTENYNTVAPLTGNDTTSPASYVTVNVKVFLQGPYSTSTGLMNANLLSIIPTSQPYSGSPWNYSGTESVTSSFFTTNNTIVDWVLVELRTGTASSTIVTKQACFIKKDGTLIDVNGNTPQFSGVSSGNYYVVIRHRNHLAVMTSSAIALSSSSSQYNFTGGTTQFYGGQAALLKTGVYGMYAGDVTGNGQIKYNGSGNDRTPILSKLNNVLTGLANGYYSGDVNLNGQVKYNGSGNDRTIILTNLGNVLTGIKNTQVP